jgi:hypothetical protein
MKLDISVFKWGERDTYSVGPLRENEVASNRIVVQSPSLEERNRSMKNGVFWDVMLCGSCMNRRFGGTSVLTRTTRRNIPEDTILLRNRSNFWHLSPSNLEFRTMGTVQKPSDSEVLPCFWDYSVMWICKMTTLCTTLFQNSFVCCLNLE